LSADLISGNEAGSDEAESFFVGDDLLDLA
jgi:hypothetical protein